MGAEDCHKDFIIMGYTDGMIMEGFSEKIKYKKLGWLHDSLKFVALFVVLFLVFRFVIGFSVVSGDSMTPTYRDGEFVMYLRPYRNPKVGDVVCVWVPSGNYYIKRVAAVGGDEVEIVDGVLWVNGERAQDEMAYGLTEVQESAVSYPYRVQEGNFFVLGDNREVSMDSRAFGEVSKLQIRGKIIFSFGGEK